MGRKADEMKELMGHLGGPSDEVSEVETEVEVCEELPLEVKTETPIEIPLEIMMNAKQERVHTEKRSERKPVIKRIYFK